ncbi:MAG: transporter [Nocardioidaceae bacterium]|nr:transporter [Nocardioidaceae bacterium]
MTSTLDSLPVSSRWHDVRTPRRATKLPQTASLLLLASIVVSFLAASAAPTPLYAIYQSEWDFSPITTTVVFGVYAIAVLVALLTFGRLSDHVGRRPVLLVAIVLQAASMLLFTDAHGVTALVVARVVQGLSTGAAVGAVGAAMLDLDRNRGTILNSVAPPIGTATGALLSGVLVQYLPAPTTLVYAVLLGVLALQAVGVLLIGETVTRKQGALRSLVPEVALPRTLRRAVATAVPVLVATWSLAGFYAALGPALVADVLGHSSFVLGGVALFTLAGVGAVTVMLTRELEPSRVMGLGITALVSGVLITLLSINERNVVGFFAGTMVAGVGFGAGFQGSIRTVVPLAQPHERAGVLSILYSVSYVAMGVPAVVAGFLVVHGGGLVPTALEYGGTTMVLALAASAGLLSSRERASAKAEPCVGCPDAA